MILNKLSIGDWNDWSLNFYLQSLRLKIFIEDNWVENLGKNYKRKEGDARNTCPILHHMLHAVLFFGHNLCVLAPNDSRFIRKVLMTII